MDALLAAVLAVPSEVAELVSELLAAFSEVSALLALVAALLAEVATFPSLLLTLVSDTPAAVADSAALVSASCVAIFNAVSSAVTSDSPKGILSCQIAPLPVSGSINTLSEWVASFSHLNPESSVSNNDFAPSVDE